MTATDYGKSGLVLQLTGSSEPARFCAIGSGSGAELVSLGSLIAEVLTDRKDFTTRDIGTTKKISFTYDFSSVQMSGTFLREFGVAGSEAKGTNDLWNREGFTAVEFDGTNELQIDVTFEVF